jgi:hypothetical protein
MGVQVRQVASIKLSEVILDWALKNIADPQIWGISTKIHFQAYLL